MGLAITLRSAPTEALLEVPAGGGTRVRDLDIYSYQAT